MRILKLVASGFRSYKNECVFEDFDDGINVIVGRNGTGKSNLFDGMLVILV